MENLMNYLISNCIGNIRKNIIILDPPQEYLDSFMKIYSFFMTQNFEHIHFIIAGYKSSLLYFFDTHPSFSRNLSPAAIYINSNQTHYTSPVATSLWHFSSFKQYAYPLDLKIKIVQSMIYTYLPPSLSVDTYVENIRLNLDYHNKTIKFLFEDFVCQYTLSIWRRKIHVEHIFLPSFEPEWIEWKEKTLARDLSCRKLLLSELFPFIALLNMINVPVTLDFIQKSTGFSHFHSLIQCFNKDYGELCFVHGQFIFKNTSSPMVFFTIHPEFKPSFFLSELLTHDYMDLTTLLIFIKNIIWYPLTHLSDSPWIKYVHTLNEFLKQNSEYQSLLQTHKKHNKTGTLYNQWNQGTTPSIDYTLIFDFIFGYCESQ